MEIQSHINQKASPGGALMRVKQSFAIAMIYEVFNGLILISKRTLNFLMSQLALIMTNNSYIFIDKASGTKFTVSNNSNQEWFLEVNTIPDVTIIKLDNPNMAQTFLSLFGSLSVERN